MHFTNIANRDCPVVLIGEVGVYVGLAPCAAENAARVSVVDQCNRVFLWADVGQGLNDEAEREVRAIGLIGLNADVV